MLMIIIMVTVEVIVIVIKSSQSSGLGRKLRLFTTESYVLLAMMKNAVNNHASFIFAR